MERRVSLNKPSILIFTSRGSAMHIFNQIREDITELVAIDYMRCTKDSANISTPFFKIEIETTKHDGFPLKYKGRRCDLILFHDVSPKLDELDELQHVLCVNEGCYFDYETFRSIKDENKYVNLHCHDFHMLERQYGESLFGDKWYSWYRWSRNTPLDGFELV